MAKTLVSAYRLAQMLSDLSGVQLGNIQVRKIDLDDFEFFMTIETSPSQQANIAAIEVRLRELYRLS